MVQTELLKSVIEEEKTKWARDSSNFIGPEGEFLMRPLPSNKELLKKFVLFCGVRGDDDSYTARSMRAQLM